MRKIRRMWKNDRRLAQTMQRIGNLYPDLCSFNNLLLAHKKALRGTKTSESMAFEFHRETELLQLQHELKTQNYQPQPYRYFTIYEPKERQISVAAYRDRVVHHAIVNMLEPIYERAFIYHSYATRKGKGTHAAIRQAQKYLQSNRWFLKCDIRKYFDSIDHQTLIGQIQHKIKDKQLLALIKKITRNAGNEKSLPIGNLTSQFFANVYLNGFDHFVKRDLKCKHYIRYMDDFVIFGNDKKHLLTLKKQISEYLKNIKLEINPRSSFINQRNNGFSYLGVRIFPKIIRIKSANLTRSLKKINQTINQYLASQITEDELIAKTNSLFAHLSNYSTLQLRNKQLQNIGNLA